MKKILCIVWAAFASAGCEVLEEDLSGQEVRIVAPTDRATVAAGEVRFVWHAAKGAAGYEFRVVAPSFAAAQQGVSDSTVYADTLARSVVCRVTLAPGEYEWSVAAFNGAYTSPTAVRRLTVAADRDPQP